MVCLVRHGTTPTTGKVLPGRAPGLHLSEQGQAEAEQVAERLAPLGVAALYSSPLERARETAQAVSRRLGLRVKVDRGLLECDFGEWTGAELSALSKLPEWSTVQHHPSGFRFPGGESFSEMRARLVGALERLVQAHPGELIVAVSHADPIKVVVGEALGQPLDLVQRLSISPCSVSAIAYGTGAPTVLTTSSTGDLTRLVPMPPATRDHRGRTGRAAKAEPAGRKKQS
ncbi:MAG: fructose-2,6-bisphosphatase [Acidimicrobiaceae bacterium]|nr:fructose-2,6-bisphosphatase [Acidimicrobiaceae bacterium]